VAWAIENFAFAGVLDHTNDALLLQGAGATARQDHAQGARTSLAVSDSFFSAVIITITQMSNITTL
jgi:hypothetical protein